MHFGHRQLRARQGVSLLDELEGGTLDYAEGLDASAPT